MTTYEIGKSYAYLAPGTPYVEPQRAEILEIKDQNLFRVLVHHPDLGAKEWTTSSAFLYDAWDEKPANLGSWRPEHTWAEVAENQYLLIVRERLIADRLTALGIPRTRRHYAGKGGDSLQKLSADARLTLSHDELESLLDAIEWASTPAS